MPYFVISSKLRTKILYTQLQPQKLTCVLKWRQDNFPSLVRYRDTKYTKLTRDLPPKQKLILHYHFCTYQPVILHQPLTVRFDHTHHLTFDLRTPARSCSAAAMIVPSVQDGVHPELFILPELLNKLSLCTVCRSKFRQKKKKRKLWGKVRFKLFSILNQNSAQGDTCRDNRSLIFNVVRNSDNWRDLLHCYWSPLVVVQWKNPAFLFGWKENPPEYLSRSQLHAPLQSVKNTAQAK